MERAKLILKPLALVSAVFLVGALVGYRAGAFQRPTAQPEPPAGQPESQPVAATQPAPQSSPTLTVVQPSQLYMMAGSKSAILLPADQLSQLTGSTITLDPQLNVPTPPPIPPAKP